MLDSFNNFNEITTIKYLKRLELRKERLYEHIEKSRNSIKDNNDRELSYYSQRSQDTTITEAGYKENNTQIEALSTINNVDYSIDSLVTKLKGINTLNIEELRVNSREIIEIIQNSLIIIESAGDHDQIKHQLKRTNF